MGEEGATALATRERSSKLLLATRIASVVMVTVVVAWFAWLSDDALITVRTALNTVNGYGPVFNIDERVQAYTHPLWFGVLVVAGWLTGQWMLMPMLLGIAATAAATGIIVSHVTAVSRVVVLTVALVLSNAFVEYATSGLENGLSYLLLAALLITAYRLLNTPTLGWAIGAGALTAALLLNRLDLILIIAPLGVYLAVRMRAQVIALIAMLVTAAIPIIAWFTFSAIYYGSLLPTTFTAKTNVDIPRGELLVSGFRYLSITFIHDPVSLVILVGGAILAIVTGGIVTRLTMIGIGLYLAYIIWIGGDFMAGRFVAVPVFLTVAALALERAGVFVALFPDINRRQAKSPNRAVRRAATIGVIALLAPMLVIGWGRSNALTPELENGERWDFMANGGIADERGFYMARARGLWQYLGTLRPTVDPFAPTDDGEEPLFPDDLVQLQAAASSWPNGAEVDDVIVRCGGLGQTGISTGPATHLIDPCGLSDAFIAEITFIGRDFAWRIGHFERLLPNGYLEAIEQADAALVEDEVLRERLERLWERIR